MARFDLSDFEWSVIQPLLPNKPRGVPRVDDRRVLNGIFWRLRTGAPWADIPERYRPHTTCVNRFNQWRKAGVWDRLLAAVSEAHQGDIQMIDSSSIRVHQHAANAKKRRRIQLHGSFARRPDHQDPCLGGRRGSADRAQAHRGPGARQSNGPGDDRLAWGRRCPAGRSRLRRQLAAPGGGRPRRLGQHQTQGEPPRRPCLQRLPVPLPQPRRALLQQAQTLPRRGNSLR